MYQAAPRSTNRSQNHRTGQLSTAIRNKKAKQQRRTSSDSSSTGKPIAFTRPARKRKPFDTDMKKSSNQNCHLCGKSNWTPEHSCLAPKTQCNICKKLGDFPRVWKSKTVNRIREENEMGSNTESWPEVYRIQSVNGVNSTDFYKAILLVERQLIEFIIDTGSPLTIMPPKNNPKELQKTTKCFVDVNRTPAKHRDTFRISLIAKKSMATERFEPTTY